MADKCTDTPLPDDNSKPKCSSLQDQYLSHIGLPNLRDGAEPSDAGGLQSIYEKLSSPPVPSAEDIALTKRLEGAVLSGNMEQIQEIIRELPSSRLKDIVESVKKDQRFKESNLDIEIEKSGKLVLSDKGDDRNAVEISRNNAEILSRDSDGNFSAPMFVKSSPDLVLRTLAHEGRSRIEGAEEPTFTMIPVKPEGK